MQQKKQELVVGPLLCFSLHSIFEKRIAFLLCILA